MSYTWHGMRCIYAVSMYFLYYVNAITMYNVHVVMDATGQHNFRLYTGTKNVARELKKISVGRVAAKGKTWFPELAEKSMWYFSFAIQNTPLLVYEKCRW